MNHIKLCFAILAFSAIVGCNNIENETMQSSLDNYVASADSIPVTTSSNLSDLTSNSRKVIRTADFRCKVDDVQKAVHELEYFTIATNGFVEKSYTSSTIQSEKKTAKGRDSLKIVQLYETTADLTIRIPVYALDSLAAKVGDISTFVHHRKLNREDVTLDFIANVLNNKVSSSEEISTSSLNKQNAIDMHRYNDSAAYNQVSRRIANLGMLDKSKYATLTIQLYQPDRVLVSTVVDVDKVLAKPFSDKVVASFGYSADILQGFVLVLVTFWPLWLIGLILAFLYKRAAKKRLSNKLS